MKWRPNMESTKTHKLPETGYLRLKHIIGDPKASPPIMPLVPVSRSTIYKWIEEGRFPAPDKRFGQRISVWSVRVIRPLIEPEE
jgi:hypothetical protein